MGTLREDPGMSLGSSRLPGGLGVGGHPERILGCPWDPPDCLEGWAWGDIQGGPWDPPVSMEGCVCEDIKGGSCESS